MSIVVAPCAAITGTIFVVDTDSADTAIDWMLCRSFKTADRPHHHHNDMYGLWPRPWLHQLYNRLDDLERAIPPAVPIPPSSTVAEVLRVSFCPYTQNLY